MKQSPQKVTQWDIYIYRWTRWCCQKGWYWKAYLPICSYKVKFNNLQARKTREKASEGLKNNLTVDMSKNISWAESMNRRTHAFLCLFTSSAMDTNYVTYSMVRVKILILFTRCIAICIKLCQTRIKHCCMKLHLKEYICINVHLTCSSDFEHEKTFRCEANLGRKSSSTLYACVSVFFSWSANTYT